MKFWTERSLFKLLARLTLLETQQPAQTMLSPQAVVKVVRKDMVEVVERDVVVVADLPVVIAR